VKLDGEAVRMDARSDSAPNTAVQASLTFQVPWYSKRRLRPAWASRTRA